MFAPNNYSIVDDEPMPHRLVPIVEEPTTADALQSRFMRQNAMLVKVNIDCELPAHIPAAKLQGYLQSRLVNRGAHGTWRLWRVHQWNYVYNYSFDRGNWCPLCKEAHDGYGFDYKVAHGRYGGWKCWKTGEWEQDYTFEALTELGPHPSTWAPKH
jgi:hypothetical protein